VTRGRAMTTQRWNLNPRRALVAVTALVGAVVPTVFAATSGASTTLSVCPSPASLTDRAAARQLLMLGFTKEDDARLALLARNGIGGFFVMGSRRSDASIKQAGSQIAAIRRGAASAKLTVPFIAVDDEGGRVQRFVGLGAVPSARELGAQPASKIRSTAQAHADKLAALGLNMDFAPVLDLDDRDNGVIADRSFSKDPKLAWAGAKAFADGLTAAGLTPVFKHFPGHGSASGDSHKALVTTPPIAELRKADLVPFGEAINSGAQVMMMGHLLVPGLTSGNTPTTWTPAAYQELRRMGFAGIVMTDDLGMGALSVEKTIGARASRAVAAGADMVLFATTNGAEQILDTLEADMKSGKLPRARVNEAVGRTLKLRCG
jgi:beta-N-acetylhexosaminidase